MNWITIIQCLSDLLVGLILMLVNLETSNYLRSKKIQDWALLIWKISRYLFFFKIFASIFFSYFYGFSFLLESWIICYTNLYKCLSDIYGACLVDNRNEIQTLRGLVVCTLYKHPQIYTYSYLLYLTMHT